MGRLQKKLAHYAVVALAIVAAAGVEADGLPAWLNSSLIEGGALSELNGVVGVNMAAGDANAQLNATAISLGTVSAHGRGIARIESVQDLKLQSAPVNYAGRAAIGDAAFSHSSGAISVNQATGVANAQANAIAISVGVPVESVSDATLAQSVTLPTLKGQPESPRPRETLIGTNAFNGARGIVQLNQSAGIGNATANGFALEIEGVGH